MSTTAAQPLPTRPGALRANSLATGTLAAGSPTAGAASPSAARRFAPEHLALLLGALACVATDVPGFVALAAGVAFAVAFQAPTWSHAAGNWLLKCSVVALGAGIDLALVLQVGLDGLGVAAVTLALAIAAGLALARVLRIERDTAILVTVGTAICGGSAIAAAAPVLRARPASVGIAIGVVFLLNAIALVLFPPLGDLLLLEPSAFGRWCALAIHDTSSVVGAAASHGAEALEVATVTKLARSLWIVPVCIGLALFAAPRDTGASQGPRRFGKPPLFVLAFVGAAALVALFPALAPAGEFAADAGRRGLTLALFAIGLSIDRGTLKQVGARHLGLGVTLWLVLGLVSLALVN